MLTKEDLQAIKELVHHEVSAEIAASEERTNKAIAASAEETRHYMNILIEGKVMPQIQILAEGHQMLLETLAPKDRVERLEEEVDFLKTVIKTLSQEVNQLKAG